jgi:hypothetical protein
MDEAIAAPRQSLDEARRFSGVFQGLAQALDCGIDAVLEVDDRLAGPELPADFFAAHQLAWSLDQQGQDPQRLAFEPDLYPALAQLECAGIEFDVLEAEETNCSTVGVSHEPKPPSLSVSPSFHPDVRSLPLL